MRGSPVAILVKVLGLWRCLLGSFALPAHVDLRDFHGLGEEQRCSGFFAKEERVAETRIVVDCAAAAPMRGDFLSDRVVLTDAIAAQNLGTRALRADRLAFDRYVRACLKDPHCRKQGGVRFSQEIEFEEETDAFRLVWQPTEGRAHDLASRLWAQVMTENTAIMRLPRVTTFAMGKAVSGESFDLFIFRAGTDDYRLGVLDVPRSRRKRSNILGMSRAGTWAFLTNVSK